MIACTIVARNYLAHARVLASSYTARHPGERLHVLVVDGEAGGFDPASQPFTMHLPAELPLPAGEFRRMAAIYDVTELATAVKPFFLRLLLDRGADALLFLDPDVEVYAPLDELGALAREHGIVLIPHSLAPIPQDGKRPTPKDIAQAGVYNLGFIGIGPEAGPFLEWWGERLRRDCLMAVEEGFHVDQRLLDFLPAYYSPHVLRDPALNVAYWNLHERDVRSTGEGYAVDGQALRFFHFSGFDPERPHLLSKHMGDRPRILLSERPDLERLCRAYAQRLIASGYREVQALPYGFSRTPAGLPLDRRMRRLYREALLAAERGPGQMPPDPLDPAQAEAFTEWLNAPESFDALPARSRLMFLIEALPYLGSRNPAVRLVQSGLLRVLRPLIDHERRVARALLDVMDELDRSEAREKTSQG